MNRFYQGDWIDSMASRFIDELPDRNIKKEEVKSGRLRDGEIGIDKLSGQLSFYNIVLPRKRQ